MEDIIDKIKPVFQNYDEGKGYVTANLAHKIIEDLNENSDESYKTIFKSANFPGNKIRPKDIAFWIESKKNGQGYLALIPIFGQRSIDKTKQMLEKFGISLSNFGNDKPTEASVTVNVSDLQVKETQLGFQISVGGKDHETLQELGMFQGRPAFIFKIKCKDPYSAATQIEDLVTNAKEILINMIPSEFAETIEKIEIKTHSVSSDYVALCFSFPSDQLIEIAKQQKEIVEKFLGDLDNQVLIDLELSTSLNLKKLVEDKDKPMSEVILNGDQALQLLFKIMVPGTFCHNAKLCATSFLQNLCKDKSIKKYRHIINCLVPLFLLQSCSIDFNFKSLSDLLKKGEDSEILGELMEIGVKKTPKEFKEDLNDEFQIKEMLESTIEGMPLLQDLLDFFKNLAQFDFEIIFQLSSLRIILSGKSEGVKEWFDFITESD